MIGYGNSMFMRRKYVTVPGVDPDAQAFITAASITDPTQQSAINQLVVDLKGYNIWTKMKALYPFVGSTASQHKWNLKDPRDLDAAFRLVFSGGWTHSSTGATPNGTNGWADTFINVSTHLALNSTHVSSYSRTNNSTSAVHIGNTFGGSTNELSMWIGNSNAFLRVNTGTLSSPSSTDSRGLWIGNRNSSTQQNLSIRGTQNNFNANSNSVNATKTINLSSAIGEFSGTRGFYDNKEYAFASIGDGLTATELSNLNTTVQAFQTTLGRSIGTQTVSDADAQAFVTNAGIVDQVEANAVNNLVIGLKADGLWTKMKAVYPMVGGSNTSTSYNLRNTAQYQIAWAGSVTSSANGVTVATNGYGNTSFNMSTQITSVNSWAVGVYVNQYTAGGMDLGSTDVTGNGFYYSIKWDGFWGANTGRFLASTFAILNFTDTNGLGFTVGTRDSSTNIKVYKSGSQIANSGTVSSTTFANNNVFLGASNSNGSASFYSRKRYAFAFIYDGSLNATENTNLHTAVQTFQTTLNRL